MSTTMVPYCPFSDNSVLWQNHFSPGSHFWPDELPCHFKMKNCNAILIASSPTRKKFHFPVGVIKSTHTEYWINGAQIIRTISRVEFIQFPIHFSYIFNHFSSTFDVDKKWIIQDFFPLQVASCDRHLNPIHHKQTRVMLFFFEATIQLQWGLAKYDRLFNSVLWHTL